MTDYEYQHLSREQLDEIVRTRLTDAERQHANQVVALEAAKAELEAAPDDEAKAAAESTVENHERQIVLAAATIAHLRTVKLAVAE